MHKRYKNRTHVFRKKLSIRSRNLFFSDIVSLTYDYIAAKSKKIISLLNFLGPTGRLRELRLQGSKVSCGQRFIPCRDSHTNTFWGCFRVWIIYLDFVHVYGHFFRCEWFCLFLGGFTFHSRFSIILQMRKRHHYRWIPSKFLPILGTHSHWGVRVLKGAKSTVTRGIRL